MNLQLITKYNIDNIKTTSKKFIKNLSQSFIFQIYIKNLKNIKKYKTIIYNIKHDF